MRDNGDGLAVFELVRTVRHRDKAVLCAFDLIEPRRRGPAPITDRAPQAQAGKSSFAARIRASCPTSITRVMARSVFKHACKFGCEGIACRSGSARSTAPGARPTG
jgi:hypothetical protein